MKKINTQLVSKQQSRILLAAKSCFFKNGLTKTTMRDIATEADISLGNIYRYFESKNSLISAFIEKDNQEINRAFAKLDDTNNFKTLLEYIVREFIAELSRKAELCVYLEVLVLGLRDDDVLSLLKLDNSEQLLKNNLQKASKDKRIDLIVPAELSALIIMGFIEKAAVKCITDPKYSVRKADEQFKQCVNIIMR